MSSVFRLFSQRYGSLSFTSARPNLRRHLHILPNLNKECGKCGTHLKDSALLCNEPCRYIQPILPTMNYFEAFDLPPQYKLDLSQVRLAFLQLQRNIHPDQFYSSQEDSVAEDVSSWINSAYATLKDPLKRAIYLLELKGHPIPEASAAQDPEILMEVMELNEELENIQNQTEVDALTKTLKVRLQELEDKLDESFKDQNYSSSQKLVEIFKYVNNVYQSARQWSGPM